jgi:hypothetical protein
MLALSIIPLDTKGAHPPHSYVTSIHVSDLHIVTLRSACTILGREYHLVLFMSAIEDSSWQTWVTSWYIPMVIATSQAPWFSTPIYKVIHVLDSLDRHLLLVAPGASSYKAALEATW